MNLFEEKSAVICSGGGAYASFEVGIMKALINGDSPVSQFQPVVPAIYTGTSAGAINAAILASSRNPTDGIRMLEKTWLDLTSGEGRCGNNVYRVRGNLFQLVDPDCYRRGVSATAAELAEDSAFLLSDLFQRGLEFFTSREPLGRRMLGFVDFASFISTDRIKRVLSKVLVPKQIRESSIAMRIVATNWRTGQARIFTNLDFTDELGISPVLGSAAIPGIFPWHKINGVPYVDGTVVENSPLKPSIAEGATTIHLIEPPNSAYFPPDTIPSAVESIYRTIVIMLSVVMQRDIEFAREINQGIVLLNQISDGRTIERPELLIAARAITRTLARNQSDSPYRPLTIHRYIPTHQFGGLVGLLDFSRTNITGMIEAGRRCAIEHDCATAGCVLPDSSFQSSYDNRPFRDLEKQPT